MLGVRAWYTDLLFTFVAVVCVGAFVAHSPLLKISGLYSAWNHANYCLQAYGAEVRGCKDGMVDANH